MGLLKEFLLDANKKLQIPGIEALAGSAGLAEIELDDDSMKLATDKFNGLMTIDAAKNTPELSDHFKKTLHPIIKGELLGNIDTDVASTVKSLFGDDAVEKLKEKEFTGDKIKFFGELAKTAIEAKGSGEENEKIKQLNTNLNKQIADGKGITDKLVKDHEKELKKLKTGHNSDLINKEFDLAINQYNLGDKYTSEDWMKQSLHTNIREKLKSIAALTLSEDKKVIPKNPADVSMALFVEGKEIKTLKDALDPLMKDFIKVNNVKDPNNKDNYVPVDKVKLSTMAQHLQERKKKSFSF